jgi:hypothetical protein
MAHQQQRQVADRLAAQGQHLGAAVHPFVGRAAALDEVGAVQQAARDQPVEEGSISGLTFSSTRVSNSGSSRSSAATP